MIDRRVISQFIIKFLQKKDESDVQMGMVLAMSKMLYFSDEERKTLGLDGSEGLLTEKPKRGFRQSLISYMMNDDDE